MGRQEGSSHRLAGAPGATRTVPRRGLTNTNLITEPSGKIAPFREEREPSKRKLTLQLLEKPEKKDEE